MLQGKVHKYSSDRWQAYLITTSLFSEGCGTRRGCITALLAYWPQNVRANYIVQHEDIRQN
jgi:hypothetical protein